jgi:hypothetical protein
MGPTCQFCSFPFIPREAAQRFCSAGCREEFWKTERREAMELRRQQREAACFGRALADEAVPAGPFAKAPARVTGIVGEPLAVPEWMPGAQLPTEPPLGVAVDELPDTQTSGGRS